MNRIVEYHQHQYGVTPAVVAKAPGVVRLLSTLLGNLQGKVIKGAIDQFVSVSISKRKDDELVAYHYTLNETKRGSIKSLKYRREERWFNFVKGIIHELELRGLHVGGMNIVINSEIPKAVGLNSSAATCVALAVALRGLYKFKIPDIQMLQICYLTEYTFMQNKTALQIDSITSYYAKKDSVVFYNSHAIIFEHYPLGALADRFYLVNSKVRIMWDKSDFQGLLDFCGELQTVLSREKIPYITSLSDITIDSADFKTKSLDETQWLLKHVCEENKRIADAISALERDDPDVMARLLNSSHASMSENLFLTTPEIDWLNHRIMDTPGVCATRLAGLGHGGCLIVLADSNELKLDPAHFVKYEHIFGYKPEVYPLSFKGGVTLNFFDEK